MADSLPLLDVVVCCTSLPDEKRTELAQYAQQMGAIYRQDLTLDATHLVVGDYNTPKYRYVAKERPDVKPMTMGWIEAVRKLWIEDKDIDTGLLEREHTLPTFTSLKFSMTGCDDATERLEIVEQVKVNGALYDGDLTKQITHLISFRTEGAKYRAAKAWGLQIISVEWVRDSLERGMILDEMLYDPVLPPEERGKDAWDRTKPRNTSLGKRSREESTGLVDGGKRKLRRTASTKLSSGHDRIWGHIVGGGDTVLQVERSGQWGAEDETPTLPNETPSRREPEDPPTLPNATVQQRPRDWFSGCRFYLHGFTGKQKEKLYEFLVPRDGEISTSLDDLFAPSNSPTRLFMGVPSNLPLSEHPVLPCHDVRVDIVTEWWVELCVHSQRFVEPGDHVIGRPFSVFPIPDFKDMIISSAAFSGVDLLHVMRAVELLGATYSANFTKYSSILLTKSTTGLRKDKLDYAQEWKTPIIDANWLWDCIASGTRLPLHKYRFRGPKCAMSVPGMSEAESFREISNGGLRHPVSRPGKLSSNPIAPAPRNARPDNTAFISDEPTASVEEELGPQNLQPSELAPDPTLKQSYKSEPLSYTNPNSPLKTVSTAPAPSNHPNPRPPKEDISNAISDLLAKTKHTTVQPLYSDPSDGRKRGKYRILGRAASNVSAASTPFSRGTSVDSTATHGNPVEYPLQSNCSTAAQMTTNEKIEKLINEGNARRNLEDEDLPSSTQLQYEDPESREYKERVMARMLGEKIDEKKIRSNQRVTTIGDGDMGARPLRKRGRPPAGRL